MRTSIKIISILLVLVLLPSSVVAYSPGSTYTYDIYGDPLELRDAYEVGSIIDGTALGLSSFKNINGLYTKDNKLYICDSGNDRIVVMNGDHRLERVIDGFVRDGREEKFSFPTDVSIASNGDIYIVDYQNFRIVVLTQDGTFKTVIDHLTSEMLGPEYRFTPSKLVLDNTDRIYVVAKGVNFGIMHIDIEGNVKSFLGSARVSFDVMNYLKKILMTKEQSKQLSKIVPTEYNNVFIDKDNFVYGTISVINPKNIRANINYSLLTGGFQNVYFLTESLIEKIKRWLTPVAYNAGQNEVVKKLNLKGDDILRRSGYYPVAGDLEFDIEASSTDTQAGPSSFTDIVVDEDNNFSVLDSNRNRVFIYDDNGVLLFAFGGTGRNSGLFEKVSAIERLGQSIIVSDSMKNNLVVFQPTEFANTVYEGIRAYKNGKYDESLEYWKKTLELSSNFEVGYIGVGRALLRTEKYKEAMYYFRLGEYRTGYDQAYEQYRQTILRTAIAYIMVIVILLGFLRYLWKLRRRRAASRNLSYK